MSDFYITKAMADAAYAWIAQQAQVHGYGQFVSMASKADIEQAAAQCFKVMLDAAPDDYPFRAAARVASPGGSPEPPAALHRGGARPDSFPGTTETPPTPPWREQDGPDDPGEMQR